MAIVNVMVSSGEPISWNDPYSTAMELKFSSLPNNCILDRSWRSYRSSLPRARVFDTKQNILEMPLNCMLTKVFLSDFNEVTN